MARPNRTKAALFKLVVIFLSLCFSSFYLTVALRTKRDALNTLQTNDDLINHFAGIHEMLGAAVANVAA